MFCAMSIVVVLLLSLRYIYIVPDMHMEVRSFKWRQILTWYNAGLASLLVLSYHCEFNESG